jgi:hypothetical protein
LKVLRAKYQDYDDIFIDVDKPTNEIKPITINQTININKAVSSTISIMNIEKTAKVKTTKSKNLTYLIRMKNKCKLYIDLLNIIFQYIFMVHQTYQGHQVHLF